MPGALTALRVVIGVAIAGLALSTLAGQSSAASSPPVPSIEDQVTTVRLLLPHQPDEESVPGCLRIVGRPAPTTCLPCPPLWLGGPGMQCVPLLSLERPPACPRLAQLRAQTIDSELFRRFCVPSAGE